MKKLLTATTALALVGGAAFAEITVSGDAEMGIDYTSEPGDGNSKHSFVHEMGVDFSGSGTTDGGLSFGGSAGFDTGDTETNTGTVFISGAFGKFTIGDNDAADLTAGGIADVGLNGIGVDDVAEDIRGTSAAQARYDNSFGNIALALSAGTSGSDNDFAIGMSFEASGATIGLGYDSNETISVGFGYSAGQISANAFYVMGSSEIATLGEDNAVGGTGNNIDGTADADKTGMGIDVSYSMGASTLTLVYAKTDLDNIQPVWDTGTDHTFVDASVKSLGVGFSHDLGGGASLVAGFGQVPTTAVADAALGHVDSAANRPDVGADKNSASIGLSFSF